jgi:DUF4097 and DUF4098 domain-containing protein YvlB
MRAVPGAVLVGSFLMLAAAGAVAEPCAFRADRNFDVDPAGLKALAFEMGSSDLRVEGVAGLGKIEVHGKACASQESWLADLSVEQQRRGDRVVVTPHQTRNSQNNSMFGSNYAYIDVEVRVPNTLRIEVNGHSGDASIANVGSVDYSAHSGDLIVKHVSGDVSVEVHSGDMQAEDIGALTIRRAGSGDINAQGVHGEVKVGNVGSGDLVLRDVARGVHVESIGSGNLSVSHAGGDVLVGSVGSGDVSVGGINGDFTVQSAGSGDIHHHDVQGRVQVPNRDNY